MKKTLLVIAVLGTLALSACSSDDKSDATPEGNNSTPQVTESTPTDITPTDTNPGASDGDFCETLAATTDLGDDVSATSDALTAAMNDSENWDSPETLATLHAEGAAMISEADEVAALFNQAASKVDDPEVAASLHVMAQFFIAYYQPMGQAAIDAESMMDFALSLGDYIDIDGLTDLTNDVMDASQVVADYTYEVCGTYY